MIEHLVAIFAGTLALGMVTWQLTRVISDGSLFEPLRNRLFKKYRNGAGSAFKLFYAGLSCRLCFGTEIAFVVTWGALITALIVAPSELPAVAWVFAFVLGPFLTAAWAEVMRRIECLEAPE
ncbi:hypothetical protein LCGC14_0288650 [marine sediment metagenome]|uniref:DUF1360 domain-containing protein n=1 Tax=marine sediment metagenome TaxID=412755 RepID=A0A0F9WZB2_9ZZZZ